MKSIIEGFGNQLRESLRIIKSTDYSPLKKNKISNVLIVGLGGSGIGANIAQSLLDGHSPVPIIVRKDYDLPAFIGPETLFIASSFSGNTEETVFCLKKAMEAGVTVACVSAGGQILATAKENGLFYIEVPDNGRACPRGNLGYSLLFLLSIMRGAGLNQIPLEDSVSEALAMIEDEKNLASIKQEGKDIASKLHNKLPIIYTDSWFQPVAVRFQQQINENAKQLCHVNAMPEMNHNELVAWVKPPELLQNSQVIYIKTPSDHPRTSYRMDICEHIFAKKSNPVITLKAQGSTPLAQTLYIIHHTDWLSLFLAELNEVEAMPVEVIIKLKSALAEKEL